MKKFLPLLGLGFGLGMAWMIGQRMSQDAMAIVLGVAVGVAASIPVSLLIVAVLRWDHRPPYPDVPMHPPQQPMIVMPQDLFKPQGPQLPPITVGENFQLLPSPKQDSRFAMQVPKTTKD
jgi:hypothetical protein